MTNTINRREFLALAGLAGAGIAGVVFASGLRQVNAAERGATGNDFIFLQMSDTHWGFTGPAVNPDAAVTLEKAVATVNALKRQPDFLVLDRKSTRLNSVTSRSRMPSSA